MSVDSEFTPAADRIEGAKAIAAFLGITKRQCHYRIDRGLLPHGREAGRIVASKRALIDHWMATTGRNEDQGHADQAPGVSHKVHLPTS